MKHTHEINDEASNKKFKHLKNGVRVRKILTVLLSTVLVLCIVSLVFNRDTGSIILNGSSPSYVNLGFTYHEDGAKADFSGTILRFLHHSADVSVTGDDKVDTKTEGTYTVSYKAKYKNTEASASRKVIVKDILGPVITLKMNCYSYTPYNHAYTEEGYTAIDNKDGDVTASVKSQESNGYVTYTATDSSGNTSTVRRAIIYDDRQAPVITLSGGSDVNVTVGDTWTDSYTATDDSDDDVTSKVTVTGTVDTNTVGDYTLNYSVSDSHDHTATAVRTVHVKEASKNLPSGTADSKAIFLTFDDGPGKGTQRLLDILDQYGVKATFFTTSSFPGYASLIGEEYRRGHAVAVHTYSHDWKTLYSSTDGFWGDFNKQNEVIHAQTGTYSSMLRFAGGSSNTISANYCSGIMSTLAAQANAKGVYYYDWNVSSGDAGETTDTSTVISNVKSQVAANSASGHASIVLQHDYRHSL